ncbi:low affinity iron permease family protein [Sphingomonas panacisoli]|uniref:Low affinity iron permease family protein n=1 Tax=Sphingomonas panacisoli TaxID=1813879 RepID=A0A5B8LP00_9SPHN|nr:low affinity iron permease family protein [Sphingomonas panacisoli]QDZ08830.1 low affinity iron permease family protein [Sphingomonas panacisoli]
MERIFETVAGKVASWTGKPPAFILALVVVVVWGVTGPIFKYSDTWQLVINTGTTIVTFLMVFLIQNAQNRDGSAIQAKLDELIRALEGPRDEFVGIENLTQPELEKIKKKLEHECGGQDGSSHESFEAFLERL